MKNKYTFMLVLLLSSMAILFVQEYFDDSENKQNNKQRSRDVISFGSYVLLDEPVFDFELLKTQLKEDWNITIPEENISEIEDINNIDSKYLFIKIDEIVITMHVMHVPIPNNGTANNVQTKIRWTEAVDVNIAKSHKAHILITVTHKEENLLDAALLYVKFCSSCLKQPNAIGLDALGTIFKPNYYIDFAEMYFEKNELPFRNLIFFGIYSNDGGNTTSCYTYGMDVFGKKNIEVIDSAKPDDEIFDIVYNIVNYVIKHDFTLKDGETIGFTKDQKLKISDFNSIVLNEETFKIDF